MTIFNHITFNNLGKLLEQLYEMHCNILIAGNTQPDMDEEYWQKAEQNYTKIKDIINEKNTNNTRR